jgi:hypothetical protein
MATFIQNHPDLIVGSLKNKVLAEVFRTVDASKYVVELQKKLKNISINGGSTQYHIDVRCVLTNRKRSPPCHINP